MKRTSKADLNRPTTRHMGFSKDLTTFHMQVLPTQELNFLLKAYNVAQNL